MRTRILPLPAIPTKGVPPLNSSTFKDALELQPLLVIGIDPGTVCGWGVLSMDGDRVDSGAWDLSMRRGEGSGMPFVRLRSHLLALLSAHPKAIWAYELVERHVAYIKGRGPQHNTYAAQQYGKIVGTMLGTIEEAGITLYVGVPVGTVKKRATGKGNAGKEAMVAAATSRWFAETSRPTEDEADALWVASAALADLPFDWVHAR